MAPVLLCNVPEIARYPVPAAGLSSRCYAPNFLAGSIFISIPDFFPALPLAAENGQKPLLKRINIASGVSLCQEKMQSLCPGSYFTLRVDSRTISSGTILR